MHEIKRTRFAPSDTGKLHIGGAMTAMLNFLMAQNMGGEFLIRIDDTDQERKKSWSEKSILKSLKWLGIKHSNEVIPRQSERLDVYRKYALDLVANGKAYFCNCSEDRVEQDKLRDKSFIYSGRCKDKLLMPVAGALSGDCIRIKNPSSKIKFKDMIMGNMKFNTSEFGDFVIIRSNGWPTYNFACVIDDAESDITHVARGLDHLSNTPKQIMMYDLMNLKVPKFAHYPLIMDMKTKKKMSKRGEGVFINEYAKMGYDKTAMAWYLASLAMPIKKIKTYKMKELINKFDIQRVRKGSMFHDTIALRKINLEVKEKLGDQTELRHNAGRAKKEQKLSMGEVRLSAEESHKAAEASRCRC